MKKSYIKINLSTLLGTTISSHIISEMFPSTKSTFLSHVLLGDHPKRNPLLEISSIVDIGLADIKTIVTDKDSDINLVVETFLSNMNNKKKIIGLDTERVQKARKQIKTVLLQLCDGDHCLIVKLPCDESVNLPVSLFNFLNLPQFTFVGIDIKKTLVKLESEWGLTCKNSVEISPATWNQTEKIGVKKFLYNFYFPPQTPIPV